MRSPTPAASAAPLLSGVTNRRFVLLAAAGSAAAISLVHMAIGRGWWSLSILCVAASLVGVQLAAVDLAEHRLPNRWTIGSLPWLCVALTAAAFIEQRPRALLTAAIAGAASGLFHLLLALAAPTGLGLGDVKLSVPIGLLLGWCSLTTAVAGVVLAFVVGGGYALALLLTRRATREQHVAFGPAMLVGAWWALLL